METSRKLKFPGILDKFDEAPKHVSQENDVNVSKIDGRH